MTGRHVVRAAGSWLRSKSACSAANASTAGSEPGRASNPKSPPGNDCEMPPAPVSNGCSQLRRLAPKWAAPILATLTPGAPKSKSHNHCAGILVDGADAVEQGIHGSLYLASVTK